MIGKPSETPDGSSVLSSSGRVNDERWCMFRRKVSVAFTSNVPAVTFLSMGHCNVLMVPGSDVQ